MRARRLSFYIGWLGALLLLFLHFDFWRSDSIELYLGWMPRELGYRLLWMVLAWIYVLYFCAWIWRTPDADEDGAAEAEPAGDDGGTP